jgi:hypothetical protein
MILKIAYNRQSILTAKLRKVTMSGVLVRVCKEAVMVYFNLLSRYSPAETEKKI